MSDSESFIAYIQVLRRVAIPKQVFELLHLNEGERVRVTVEKVKEIST